MSLIGDYKGVENCRFSIDSLEFHKGRKQLRVRIKVFSPSDVLIKRFEEKITYEKMLSVIDYGVAESMINKTSITKTVNKIAKEKELNKRDNDMLKVRMIDLEVAKQMKVLADDKINKVIDSFVYSDNGFKSAYMALKQLPKYEKMIDQD